MSRQLQTIAFDADDTLWHNERFFQLTQDRFADLLRDYTDAEDVMHRLEQAERRNIGHYGFGVKGFVLSMIETAIEVTDQRVPAAVIQNLLDAGQEMLDHPIELLPHAQEAVERAAQEFHVMLITKGDLLHQERKLAQSGLGDLFDAVEIVSDKQPDTYARLFGRVPGGAPGAMMIGNSMKSDVRPAIDAGGWGVFVPHDLAWSLEHAEPPVHPRFRELPDLSGLAGLIDEIG
ncbi:MAG: HAD family hydrolase [Pelagimonas sp.]|jgi:putative hydrolase of the HAD superfamily|nr:HAD family hydrolase [Pelagimonas sp.]